MSKRNLQGIHLHAITSVRKAKKSREDAKDVNWDLLFNNFPFNLPNPDGSKSLVTKLCVEEVELAGYGAKLVAPERVNQDTVTVDENIHHDSELSSFPSSPASSPYYSSGGSDGDKADDELDSDNESEEEEALLITYPQKKTCGAMWRPECRRAGRCTCYDKLVENEKTECSSDEKEFSWNNPKYY